MSGSRMSIRITSGRCSSAIARRRRAAGGLERCESRRSEARPGRAAGSSRCRRRSGRARRPRDSACRPGRQREAEGAAFALRALDPEASAVQLDEACARAAARGRSLRCRLPAPRAWPNSSKISSWSSAAIPGPVSVTATSTVPFAIRRGDVDTTAGGRELDGIRDQVEHDLAQLPLVRPHRDLVRLELEPQLDAVPGRALGVHRQPALERPAQRNVRELELHPAGFDLREIEDVVDQQPGDAGRRRERRPRTRAVARSARRTTAAAGAPRSR